MRLRAALLTIALWATPWLASASPPAPKIVAFNVAVRVDVDARGAPVRVDVAKDLPAPVRSFIESQVRQWQYQPATLQGVAVPATTYVQVAACAIPTPAGDAFSLAVDFEGNGPRQAGDVRMPPLRYPEEAMRRGISAAFALVVDVATDGSARLASIERTATSGNGRPGDFEPELRRWVESLRFDPEQVAGQPVAGKVRLPVSFRVGNVTGSSLRRERQDEARASRQCRVAAAGGGMRPVAVDAVVKVTPVPAG